MGRSALLFLVGLVLMLLVVETLLHCLPVSSATRTGYHIDPVILTYPPQHSWTASTGWDLRNSQRLSANNLGFVAARDFTSDRQAIGLIGDSYVEAGMLDLPERPAAQLELALQFRRPVYALGAPGSALLDYAERIRFASERLGIHDFIVVMEAGDVRQSICGSGNVHGPCLDPNSFQPRLELLASPSWAKRVFRHSALAQYAMGQLKFDAANLMRKAMSGQNIVSSMPAMAAATSAPRGIKDERWRRDVMVETVAQHFFDRIKPYATGQLVFVVDGRRSAAALKSDAAANTALMQERSAFIALARQHGATVIDAETLYHQHWIKSGLALEVGPYDGHLNSLGVGLLMRAVAESFR